MHAIHRHPINPIHEQIPFAFFVVGGVVSVVVGPLADVMNRKHLYVLTCLTGTIPCLLTYWCVCVCRPLDLNPYIAVTLA